ncbi:MAG: ABC transporter ATP-binding protein [Defluviitaleaceae bacterium]|nr:ABC transporter ATP-binding protein [Defluviitaleaceae bacterium]
MDNVLEIKELSKNYGKTQALKGVSFDIPKGKIVGVLGPNGSGKTTIIKTVMGLLSDYGGDVRIMSETPGFLANRHISYLPDVSHIPTWLTVNQAIGFFSDFYQDFDTEKARGMLADMKIPTDKKLKTLSRGMQEKVQLSLVMSRKAKLYVLDEPIGAVDPASREFIIDTILRNYSEDSSILLSTHIIADIEPILDVAIFIKDGEIVLHDEVDKIREDNDNSLDQLFREVFRNVH